LQQARDADLEPDDEEEQDQAHLGDQLDARLVVNDAEAEVRAEQGPPMM
jgi:hypothetical protein